MFELDCDEYPTDETIAAIIAWEGNPSDLFYIVSEIWPSYGRMELRSVDNMWEVVTGGWSGCEELVEAFNSNIMLRHCWMLSKRGGYHEYENNHIIW